ncbi:hypothetical protein pb186bvf_007647 [Paramecium bursaria]
MIFQVPQELLFLQDTLQITLDPNQGANFKFMAQTYQQYKGDIILSQQDYIIDSALLEVLQHNGQQPLLFLTLAKQKIEDLIERPWFQVPEVQKMGKQLEDMIQNYSTLAITCPDDLFPNRAKSEKEMHENYEVNKQIARIFDVLENMGFDPDFYLDKLNLIDNPHEQVFILVAKWISQIHIFSAQVDFYFGLYQLYFSPQFKPIVFKFTQRYIVPQGEKTGEEIEKYGYLSPLVQLSLLQQNQYLRERAHSELSGKMTRNTYEQRAKKYEQKQREHTLRLTQLIRDGLKKDDNIDYFTEIFKFIKITINGNQNKIKEGLHLNNQAKKAFQISSDGFMLNLYDVFLELSRKIFQRNDATFERVQGEFLKIGHFKNETPILAKIKQISQDFIPGQVSYLYFYTIKLAQLGFVPSIVSYKEILKQHDEIKKQISYIENPNPLLQGRINIMKEEMIKLEQQANQYESVLFQGSRLRDTLELYDSVVFLIKEWGNLKGLFNGDFLFNPRDIYYYLPEYYITDIIEINLFFIQFKDDYLSYMTYDRMSNLMELAVYLFNQPIVTNKYLAAQLIEILYFLLKTDKKNVLIRRVLKEQKVLQDNLLIGLMKQYVNVGETGDNRQFYTKFSYRFYLHDIFQELLRYEQYQEQLQIYQQKEVAQRIIKLMQTDLDYSFEEAWSKLDLIIQIDEKVKKSKDQVEKMKLNQERHFTVQQYRSNLGHIQSTMKMLAIFSNFVTQLMTDGVYRNLLITVVNQYLAKLFKKENQQKVRQLKEIGGKEFKLDQFLQNIVIFYVNMCRNKECIKVIISDERSYRFQYFQKLYNRIASSVGINSRTIEDFNHLLNEIQESQNDCYDITELIDIPDEFIDPLYSNFMRDPVQLPQSKTIIDRNTIKTSLLEKKIDPFTNTPLEEKDLIELPELKKKIEKFLADNKPLIEQKIKEQMQDRANKLKQQKQSEMEIEEEDEDDMFQGKKYDD